MADNAAEAFFSKIGSNWEQATAGSSPLIKSYQTSTASKAMWFKKMLSPRWCFGNHWSTMKGNYPSILCGSYWDSTITCHQSNKFRIVTYVLIKKPSASPSYFTRMFEFMPSQAHSQGHLFIRSFNAGSNCVKALLKTEEPLNSSMLMTIEMEHLELGALIWIDWIDRTGIFQDIVGSVP